MALVTLAFSCTGDPDRSQTGDRPDSVTTAAAAQEAPPMRGPAGEYTSNDSLPRIRYVSDGQISLNDRCPVRKVRLNPRLDPLYVNGRPIGFC